MTGRPTRACRSSSTIVALRALSALLVLAGLASACAATVPMAPAQQDALAKLAQAPPERGLIYVFRDEGFGGAVEMKVSFDGAPMGSTGPKTFLMWEAPPGPHEVSGKAENTAQLPLVVEHGRAYFVWQEVKMGVWSARNALKLVDEAEGRRRVAGCKLAQTAAPPGAPAVPLPAVAALAAPVPAFPPPPSLGGAVAPGSGVGGAYPAAGATCFPPCRSGFVCQSGACVAASAGDLPAPVPLPAPPTLAGAPALPTPAMPPPAPPAPEIPRDAPEEARAAYLRSLEYRRLGRLAEADGELRAAEAAAPGWHALNDELAVAAERAGRLDEALERLHRQRERAAPEARSALDQRIAALDVRVRDQRAQVAEAERARAEAEYQRAARAEAEQAARAARLAAQRAEDERYARLPFYRKGWFWSLVGGTVLAGAGATTVAMLRRDPTCPEGVRCR